MRTHQPPVFTRADEAMVYRLSRAVMEHRGLDDATYAQAEAMLGRAGLVELITLIGYFEVLPQSGARPLDDLSP